MSKKATSLMIAALTLAMSAVVSTVISATSAFAIDATHHGRKQIRMHQNAYNARASAASRVSTDWPYGAREPFTAAEKRTFQTPTGAEVDRW